MSAQPAVRCTSSLEPTYERLTWTELRAQYPERWVVLADVQWRDDTDVVRDALFVSRHICAVDAERALRQAAQELSLAIAVYTGELDRPLYDYFPERDA